MGVNCVPGPAGVGTDTQQRVEGRGRKNQLRRGPVPVVISGKKSVVRQQKRANMSREKDKKVMRVEWKKCDHCTTQQPPLPAPGDEYGSSFFATGPHTDGTRGSFVTLQYRIKLALASLTLILGRARSSLSLWLCSVRRRSLSSDIDCLCGREFIMEAGRG